MANTTNSPKSVETALRWIGDLDHPFYNDERQRFVWYEASAIGFQLLILLMFGLAGIAMLVAGVSALPIVLAMVVPIATAAAVVRWYSERHHAPFWPSGADLRRKRGAVGFGLVVLYGAGIIRLLLDLGDSDIATARGLRIGIPIGAIAALVGLYLGMRRQQRRTTEETMDD